MANGCDNAMKQNELTTLSEIPVQQEGVWDRFQDLNQGADKSVDRADGS
jgi:hypothetical protein